MTGMAQRVSHYGTTIFTEMTQLANEHGAINLGQGFPDFAAPDFIKTAAQKAVAADINQYAPGAGRPRLRQAIAAKMADHYDFAVDPDSEITVTHGATEAIFAAMMGLINPGDEVIVFEPYYDCYVPAVQMAGGIPRFHTLRPPDWSLRRWELAALFNDRTRAILINTPHNPTGKVFNLDELTFIANLCQQYDVIAIMDEVYEHLIYDGGEHTLMAALPGMRERTVTISSMAKTFSVTGWKVGWTIAPRTLNLGVFRAHQFITFCGAAPLQEASAAALEHALSIFYYDDLLSSYQIKRDFMVKALRAAGLTPIVPAGTYFIMVDITPLGFPDDVAFCRYLTQEIGVAAIPPSAFYQNPGDGAGLARFAFCKTRPVLEAAAERLQKLK